MGSRLHLHRLLFIVLATSFVALLIGFTGEFGRLWPLYGLSIIVAALTYHTAGAVVMTAIAAALLGFHTFSAGIPLTAEIVAESAIGLAVFLVSGLIVGVLTQRQELTYQELERISVYDPLTGAYSASYLRTRLEEEMRRRARYGGDIALLLLELDDLKVFNDTFGTHRGDLLLAHLAEILKISVRNTDILARYRGGTFALICPHCGHDEASEIAQRLMRLVEETEFEGDELEPVTRQTMSVGIGTCADSVCGVDVLLELAESDFQTVKASTSEA